MRLVATVGKGSEEKPATPSLGILRARILKHFLELSLEPLSYG